MEPDVLFTHLESNQPHLVEEAKKVFHENLNATKEPWLINGLFDYFVTTSSMHSVEILIGIKDPHIKHLFDRFSESLKGPSKLQALTLLGHVVKKQPTWLYKITQHPLMKDLLKLLKVETDILPLMSALLAIISLLPMIPALVGPYLQDVFDVFSRLAAWNTMNPNKVPEELLLHLQLGLYFLFQRLYGMYPCNFLSYLRNEYGQREHLEIFSHTIKPMLDTVKMHPLLVIASKDSEIGTSRWKKMEHHDVIVECAKFALDTVERSRDDVTHQNLTSSYRSRGSLEYSGSIDSFCQLKSTPTPTLGSLSLTTNLPSDKELWSPSIYAGLHTPPLPESAPTSIPQTPNSQSYIVSCSLPLQEGTSPPEAAIEATPETTPIKDIRHVSARPTPSNLNVVRALNSLGSVKRPANTNSSSSTPTQSQPCSPMKKEPSPFRFPEEGNSTSLRSAFETPRRDSISSPHEQRRDSVLSQRVQRVVQDRNQSTGTPTSEKSIPNFRPKTPGGQPTSPLRVITNENSIPNSPVQLEAGIRDWIITQPIAEKNGLRLEGVQPDSSQEDREVLEIVRQGEELDIDTQPKSVDLPNLSQRECDSVLQEFHPPHDEYEECQQESGSPCSIGGLHMPDGRSVLDYALRLHHHHHRQRFYSQCVSDPVTEGTSGFSTGSSPGEGFTLPLQGKVRRVNSCPEMKKGPSLPAAEVSVGKTLDENEEMEEMEGNASEAASTKKVDVNEEIESKAVEKLMVTSSTQTLDNWQPMPYEHLFWGVLPSGEHNGDQRSSSAPSPATVHHESSLLPRYSPYTMLDKFIETAVQVHNKEERESKKLKSQGVEGEMRTLREHLLLLNMQLQFERHRREVHAERNRRLLGKSRTNRALEEHNSALRDQLTLLQKDIENLHNELEKTRKEAKENEQQLQDTINYWQNQSKAVQEEIKDLRARAVAQERELLQAKEKTAEITKEYQQVESTLFNVNNEWQQAMVQASAGEHLRSGLDRLQRELILMGELQQKYREHLSQLPLLRNHEEEIAQLYASYSEEMKALHELLESRSSSLEAAKARVAELEAVVTRRDMLVVEQKRVIKLIKEEYQDQLEAVESKYQTQRAINQRLQEHVLELNNRIEQLDHSKKKGKQSPDSSGAHEVSVGSAGSAEKLLGPSSFSPHNSPLSESLASAEGVSCSGILGGEGIGIKNLQMILDQPVSETEPQSTLEHTPGEEG